MVHLAGGEAVHLEKIDEEHAVLVRGLVAMGGNAPVRSQLGLLAIELVEAQHRIRISYIDC